ncbi:MAG: extradiol dioxygenase [Bacteroidetes bacterium]|jgi:predicted lactoylglutathione lyase|nr:extradiol dioxygenase [Bacteroidota bacterium]
MTKQIWLNLPVKDIKRSKEFFAELGFRFNTKHGDSETAAVMLVGENNFVIMLFTEDEYKKVAKIQSSDTTKGSELLISIDAESREEVELLTAKAEKAGGIVFGKPAEVQGWMYGSGFTDLDGHRWNILHMDMSKMPK